jgi:hypothetical protein
MLAGTVLSILCYLLLGSLSSPDLSEFTILLTLGSLGIVVADVSTSYFLSFGKK